MTLFSLEIDQITRVYKPDDRNLFADHITEGGLTQLAYQEGRPDILWAVRTDGVLLGLTLAVDQQVSGWHRHVTEGKFISIATTPRVKDYDTLWACVEREIDGVTRYYIEYLNDEIVYPKRAKFFTGAKNEEQDNETYQRALFEAQKEYIHLDAALTYDGCLQGIDAGASISVFAVTGTGVNTTASAAIFSATDVGRELRVKSKDGTRYGIGIIESYISDTEVTIDIVVDFDSTEIYPAGEWYITTASLSGLDHLTGEKVGVVVDGAVHPDVDVVDGAITLSQQASVVHVGKRFTGTLESLNLDGGARQGTAQTKKINVTHIGVRLLNTSGLSYGSNYYKMEEKLLREAVDLMDNPPPLVTRDEYIKFQDAQRSNNAGWSREKRIILQQDLPLPATIQLITPYFTLSEG